MLQCSRTWFVPYVYKVRFFIFLLSIYWSFLNCQNVLRHTEVNAIRVFFALFVLCWPRNSLCQVWNKKCEIGFSWFSLSWIQEILYVFVYRKMLVTVKLITKLFIFVKANNFMILIGKLFWNIHKRYAKLNQWWR